MGVLDRMLQYDEEVFGPGMPAHQLAAVIIEWSLNSRPDAAVQNLLQDDPFRVDQDGRTGEWQEIHDWYEARILPMSIQDTIAFMTMVEGVLMLGQFGKPNGERIVSRDFVVNTLQWTGT